MESREKPFLEKSWDKCRYFPSQTEEMKTKWKILESFHKFFEFCLTLLKIEKALGDNAKVLTQVDLFQSFWFICRVAAETVEFFWLFYRPDELSFAFAFSLFIEAISPSKSANESTLKIKNRLFSFAMFPGDL